MRKSRLRNQKKGVAVTERMDARGGRVLASEAAPNLEPWQEVIGAVDWVEVNEGGIEVAIRGIGIILLTGLSEREAHVVSSIPEGTRVSVLRTDLPHRPYILRVLPPGCLGACRAARGSSP